MKDHGFTLLEMLAGLLIMLVLAMAVLTFTRFANSRASATPPLPVGSSSSNSK